MEMATEEKISPEGKLIRWATAIGYVCTVAIGIAAFFKYVFL